MSDKELKDVVHTQSEIIQKQTRKINLLEEKFSELRSKYLRLKYSSKKAELHLPELF